MTDDNLIMDESELVEALDDDAFEEAESDHAGLEATEEPVSRGMEFTVQMKGYRLGEFEDAVVEAAARVLIGRDRKDALAKRIEERCIALTSAKVDEHLAGVTADFLDQPMIPQIGSSKDPVTLREFIGLCGREYLTQHVDRDGKPAKPSHYNSTAPRIQQVLQGAIDKRFKAEIDAASRSVIAEMRDAAKAQFDALLVAEKARIRKAFDRHTEA